MNKKVLMYSAIGLGVIGLGAIIYLMVQKSKETKSTTEANASNTISNQTNQQGVTTGQMMLPPALQGLTQAQINALLSGGKTM